MNCKKTIKDLRELNSQLKGQYRDEQNRNYCLQCKIDKLEQENKKYKEVIDKAMSKLGRYADELTGNGNAYAVCVDLLGVLKEVE